MQEARGSAWRPRRPHRRGSVANALLISMAVLMTAAVSIVVIRPGMVEAGGVASVPDDQAASDPVHQQVIEQIARIIGHSRAVLFVHDTDGSPYREILLWMSDGKSPGNIDPGEIALLSFSPTLEAIAFYALEPSLEHDPAQAPLPDPGSLSAAWEAGAAGGLAFCDAWRTHPEVTRRIIATRVRHAEWAPPEGYRPSDGLWRITLTWALESADQTEGHPNRDSSRLSIPTASITVAIDARSSDFEE